MKVLTDKYAQASHSLILPPTEVAGCCTECPALLTLAMELGERMPKDVRLTHIQFIFQDGGKGRSVVFHWHTDTPQVRTQVLYMAITNLFYRKVEIEFEAHFVSCSLVSRRCTVRVCLIYL
jgi:hypothetical protein